MGEREGGTDAMVRLIEHDETSLRTELESAEARHALEDVRPVVLRLPRNIVETPPALAADMGLVLGGRGAVLSGTERRVRTLAASIRERSPQLARAILSALAPSRPTTLRARGKVLHLGERTLVMGVINLSPDSFSGDGLRDPSEVTARARRFLEAGADVLDIGGMSTRPGSEPVPEEVEAGRLRAAIEAIRPLTGRPISADTYRPGPAEVALEAGADIINDVSGLRGPRMAELVASRGAGVVVMHMQGEPRTMQQDPRYEDVVREVYESLARSAEIALGAGVPRDAIVIDPGIGFGKTVSHNLELLHRLRELATLGYPVLVGTSRKGFIGRITGREPQERIFGTAATVALAIAGGADIVRVHDVEEMVDVCRVADAVVRWRGRES